MNLTPVGTLTWHPTDSVVVQDWPQRRNKAPVWGIKALPHVAMRAKRVFPRIETSSTSTLYLLDTPQTAAEIDWFTLRFPLEMDADTRSRLTAGVQRQQERETAIDQILNGAGTARLDLAMTPGMKPRDYQQQYVDLINVVHRLLLGDGTGVGKTITAALGFALPDALPALVAMPTNLPPQWTQRMNQLWPMLTVHTLRGTRPYDFTDVRELHGHQPDILLAPYSRLAGWRYALAGKVRTVVFDEVQNLRTGVGSEKGKAARHLSDEANYAAGLSATPAHNYGPEFWDVLNIISPGALGSREEFLREWGGANYGTHQTIKDPAAFGTYLRTSGLMLARTRKDVGREIPEPVIDTITIDANSKTLDSFAEEIGHLANQIVDSTTASKDRFLLAGQLDYKMRHATGLAKAPFVAEHVRNLLEGGEDKIVLVGWHRDVYDVWQAALRPYGAVMYTGSENTKAKDASVQQFMRPTDEGGARVLMMSLASGAGLDGLQEVCSMVVFGELDWSPKVHSQIIDRFNRDGQTSTVVAQYLVVEEGSDPAIIEVLGLKADQTDPVMDPDVALFAPINGDAGPRGTELAKSWLHRHHSTKSAV